MSPLDLHCQSVEMVSVHSHLASHPACRKAEGKATSTAELPPEYLSSPLSQQSQVYGLPCPQSSFSPLPWSPPHTTVCPQLPPKRDDTALQEEEELQLALALSQSEAEEKERMVRHGPRRVTLSFLTDGGPQMPSMWRLCSLASASHSSTDVCF